MLFGPLHETSPTGQHRDADRTNAGAGRGITWNVDRGSMMATAHDDAPPCERASEFAQEPDVLGQPRGSIQGRGQSNGAGQRLEGCRSEQSTNVQGLPRAAARECSFVRTASGRAAKHPDARSSQMQFLLRLSDPCS